MRFRTTLFRAIHLIILSRNVDKIRSQRRKTPITPHRSPNSTWKTTTHSTTKVAACSVKESSGAFSPSQISLPLYHTTIFLVLTSSARPLAPPTFETLCEQGVLWSKPSSISDGYATSHKWKDCRRRPRYRRTPLFVLFNAGRF
jgi:hypothetical protein